MADPVEGGRQAVAEAWRNLTATGAKPLAITDCMNFGNPERPEIMGQFVGCVEGMGEACRALDFPVVSGNVSLYNETNGVGVLPTPDIGGVGLLDNLDHMATLAFKSEDETIILIGETKGHLGASIYLREIGGQEKGVPPHVDLAVERRNGDFVRTQIHAGKATACHDVADGGLFVALAEMAMAGDVGAAVNLPDGLPAHAWLFGEDQARYVVTCRAADKDAILSAAKEAGVPAGVIGRTGGSDLTAGGGTPISLSRLRKAHEEWLPTYMSV
jgi:phosphoribosylformylglycinamidine synthase